MTEKYSRLLLFSIVAVLTIIPFFWLKPGEMDLGGDSSRLYFYDPYNYFKYNLLFAIVPGGFNIEQPLLFSAPFVAILIFLKKIIPSSYLLITLFNSLNLAAAFLSMYGMINELLADERKKRKSPIFLAAIFTGIYYIFSPVMVRSAWDKALITHAQIFLNPLVFYLLLRYMRTNKVMYLLSILLITVIFSVNFSWAAAPILFGFYPFAVAFLFLYASFAKIKFNYLPVFLSAILFILLHAFHYVPLIMQIVNKSGAAFARLATSQSQNDIGLSYFTGIAPSIRLTENLLGLPQMVINIIPFPVIFFFVPILLLIGLWLNTKKHWDLHTRVGFLLAFGMFLVLLFFITANITNTGFEFYKQLFKIPGFSMFRNFYGQWMFGYLFFLSLLLGYSLFYALSTIKYTKIKYALFLLFTGVTIFSAFPFIEGKMINLVLNIGQRREFKIPIKMDPEYEKILQYIRDDTVDAKYLTLPFTEAFNQMLAGTQGGMYQGPSTIPLLTGHSDFVGYQVITPFNEVFLALAKEKKYTEIGQLLGLLNVRYVFYNSDVNIMKYFPDFPYQHVKNFLPKNQEEYKKFVEALPIRKKIDLGNKYHIYQLSDAYYLPPIYIAKEAKFFKKNLDAWGGLQDPFFVEKATLDPRIVYIEEKKYDDYVSSSTPRLTFQKTNPTKYKVQISDANGPYILVLSHAFNPNWKLYLDENPAALAGINEEYFNGDIKEAQHKHLFFDWSVVDLLDEKPIADNKHFLANGYSNGWAIAPSDVDNQRNYTLVVEMQSQRFIYLSLIVSAAAFVVLLGWMGAIILRAIRSRRI